ncbi:MAG: diguanylate cyclase [Gammaproteobacteria bacterium]|nr:diguanylate cyclase [Gammaproteobacteria bacterium]
MLRTGLKILLPYSIGLAAFGWSVLLWLSYSQSAWPLPSGELLLFVGLSLFFISGGFSGPHVGHTSLDRLAQVGAVLVLGTLSAGWVAAITGLLWPLLDRRHNRGDFQFLLMRSLHSSGMFTLIVLGGGYAFEALGGATPLASLTAGSALLLLLMAAVMQLINEALMAVYAQFNEGDWRKWFSGFATLLEIGTVPLGVFSAIVYNTASTEIILLYGLLLVMFMVILRRFAKNHWELAERVNALTGINQVGRAISTSLIIDDLAELVFQQCRKLIDFTAFFLVLYDEESDELDFRLHHNDLGRQPRKRKKRGEGAIGWIIQNNRGFLVRNWDESEHEAKQAAVIVGRTPGSVIGVPVSYDGKVLGAISVQSFKANVFDESDFHLLMTLSDQVAIAMANARMFTELDSYRYELEDRVEQRTREIEAQKQELVELSESLRETNAQKENLLQELRRKTAELDRQSKEDSLTGLYNRRFMDQRLAEEFKRAERFGHAMSVAVLDVDSFKQINDGFSHVLADDVLRKFADIIREQCRAIDIISRYGGDEFLLCLPETDVESAAVVCEKIRKAVCDFDWHDLDPGLVVTTSIGVASYDGKDLKQALLAADAKLYEAKRGGRNRVCA